MAKEKVLIVGGGFGGIKTALELADSEHHEVTLLSDRTNFRYYPTLYQTATGGAKESASISLRALFADTPVRLVQETATTVDKRAKTITTASGQVYEYDILVLALGVVTNYFGIQGLEEFSYSIKSSEEVDRFKAELHRQLTAKHEPDLNYVIVGAGPTGIELAGELPHYLRRIMKNHGISHRTIHIDLIEAAPKLLPRLPRDTSRLVQRRLKRLGIKVMVNSTVQGETADELTVNGKPIRSHTVVWTAGVTNHPFFKANGFTITSRGKVSVDAYLQTEENIYVIGDNANTPYSGMAQTAIHDARFVADNLKRKATGRRLRSYNVKQPVTVIPVGPHWAAVLWGAFRPSGWIGWMLRELADLVGFHDYENWLKASEQWLTELDTQETCPICLAAEAK